MEALSPVHRACACLFYGSGIIGTLLIYGLLQERIMSVPYDGELFGTSIFLVFLNRFAAVAFASGMAFKRGEGFWHVAPLWKYVAISLSNVYASACQYEALKYVAFPVQMLGKSFKMMPVMLWGMVVSHKRYKLVDWLVAATVTLGVTQFLMTGPISSKSSQGTSFFGLGLLVAFLCLDGFTSTYQEVLFKEHRTSKYNQMIWVNFASCLVSLATLLLTRSLGTALSFVGHHPAFLADATILSGSAVAAQWFIYSQVKEFGALVFAATMNVRQVTSILLSYVTYGHSITLWQMIGLFMVFSALFFKSAMGVMTPPEGFASEKAPLVDSTEKPQTSPMSHEKV